MNRPPARARPFSPGNPACTVCHGSGWEPLSSGRRVCPVCIPPLRGFDGVDDFVQLPADTSRAPEPVDWWLLGLICAGCLALLVLGFVLGLSWPLL